ncbi:phosphopantetheine-binding protein, partial [Kitasatospora sp. NPDC057198]|uniref:phosphopantetheine-binding protein n=1 Tax=Kitasatospora sp. NPDC057198 TaxID=3346046 RepID=UPI003642B7E2
VFVELERLPLTPNGKVDRKALPEPESHRRDLAQEFVAPRTEAERVIAAIWSNILGIAEVGVHDNFFELGGHSLLATQVASRLRDHFHLEVPVRTVFSSPTIESLAVTVGRAVLRAIRA